MTGVPRSASDMQESPFAKIAADLRQYARQECVPCSPGFILRMVLMTPGFQFVLLRRIQEILHGVPVIGRPLRRLVWWFSCFYGSEIGMAASVGGGLYIPHPYGIVLGICEVGRNVAVMQNVTIGRRKPGDQGAAVIGDEVLLSAGAVILGAVHVGAGAVVAANSVVLIDVPAGGVAAGVPARVREPKAPSPAGPSSELAGD